MAAGVLINSTAMGNRGWLMAPGGLRDELAEMAEDEPAAGESLAEMAAQYGLTPSSIGWRHAVAAPVRALLLAWRVLPAPLRGWLRLAGPYGRAAVLWGAGERDAALASLAGSPRRLAAFALAADQPAVAAAAVERLTAE